MAVRQTTEDTAARIERLIAAQERSIQRAFRLAIQNILDASTLDELADLLAAGDLTGALANIEAAGRILGGAYGASMTAAAQSAAQFLSTALTVQVVFDQGNPLAVEAFQRNRLRLVQSMTQETRAVAQAAISDGIERGLNPREQARNFRQNIGLSPNQQQYVANYRAALERNSLSALTRQRRDRRFDSQVRRASRSGEPLTSDQIDRMVNRYRERLIALRAETIARTEALRSVHEGNNLLFQQAINEGNLQPDELQRKWVTARDLRVRDTHNGMNGQVVGIDEPFRTDNGNRLQYPGDFNAPASETVNCRCVVTTRIVQREAEVVPIGG